MLLWWWSVVFAGGAFVPPPAFRAAWAQDDNVAMGLPVAPPK